MIRPLIGAIAALSLLFGQVEAQTTGVTPFGGSQAIGSGLITATNNVVALSAIGAGDVVGNNTSGSAVPVDATLTSIIDQAIGSTQGSILYRNASTWVALTPGSNGTFLQSQGAAANPQWAASASSPIAASAVSGNWYNPPFTTESTGSVATGSRMVCVEQVNILTSLTVKSLAARVVTAGTTNSQLAIYANSGGFPNGAPLGNTANLVNTSSNANIGTAGDVTNFSLPVGPYWACVMSNDSTVVFMAPSQASTGVSGSALAGSATLANIMGTGAVVLAKFQAVTFGTWPTVTSSGWTESTTTLQGALIAVQAN